jgi:two-component system cell cycle sensor histidine kinase/response regulator CckA
MDQPYPSPPGKSHIVSFCASSEPRSPGEHEQRNQQSRRDMDSTSGLRSQATRSFTAFTYLSLFGLAVTIPLLLMVGALLLQSASVQRAQLEARALQAVDALVSDIDRDLDRDVTILHTLATLPSVQSEDWPTFYAQAKAALQGRAYLVLVDPTGRQLVNTYLPYGKQPPMTGDPESVRQIVQTKKPVVSNLFMSLAVKKPVFNVSIPVLRDGQVSYVMSLGMLPDDLTPLLTEENLGPEWVSLVWDRKGIVLARSQDNAQYTGKPLPQNWREEAEAAAVKTTSLDGIQVLKASKRLPLSGWGVAVNVPYSLVTAEMRKSLMLWGLGSLIAISIACVSGMFFARQITTSLSAATQAAGAFGRGKSFPLEGSRLKEADEFLITLKDAHQAREQLTEELKQNRDWLQTTLNSIGDGVITTDRNGNVTMLNPVAQSLTGWIQDEAAGVPLEQVFVIRNAESGLEVENPASRALRQGQIVALANHTLLLARDGRRIPIDDSAAPISDGDKVAGVVLIFRDITERYRMEDELRQASDTVSAIIAGSPVAIWLVDTAGKIALWNSAAEKLFGYTFDDVISRAGLFHLQRPSGDEILKRLADGEVIVGLEAVCRKRDTGIVDVSFSTSVLHNRDGSPRGFVALAVDVTEQKKLDEQMRQSQKLESIGLLAGGIAHDFNNLLTGVIGNASLLATEDVSQEFRECLEQVVKAGERGADLTKQLLAYAGKGQFYIQPVNVSAVIRALLPLIRTSLSAKAEMELNVDDALPAIQSDRSQIEQVIMNLVINAGEALGDRAGRITVRTWAQELNPSTASALGLRPGSYSCLEVADTGCGMDDQTRARIFEPFFTTKFTGRGLGLAAVHGIMRSCNGGIHVESHQGRGTRFTVFFPATAEAAVDETGCAPALPPKASGLVLVVDDEDMVRSIASAALRRFGYTVITAVNGREAVERFREAADRIDAVLLDIKMPVMDGHEALKELKRIRPDVRVLISSGFSESEAHEAFKGQGVAGFVQKPYRAPVLAEAVQQVIQERNLRSHSV